MTHGFAVAAALTFALAMQALPGTDSHRLRPDRSGYANLVLAGGGHRWRANADGNGAIDALMRAVDNALAPLLGAGVVLTAYDVHATRAGHEAKASVSVGVRRRDADDAPVHAGKAVDENVLQASVVAYIDAVNALLEAEGIDIASAVPSPGDTDLHETDPEHRSRDARPVDRGLDQQTAHLAAVIGHQIVRPTHAERRPRADESRMNHRGTAGSGCEGYSEIVAKEGARCVREAASGSLP